MRLCTGSEPHKNSRERGRKLTYKLGRPKSGRRSACRRGVIVVLVGATLREGSRSAIRFVPSGTHFDLVPGADSGET